MDIEHATPELFAAIAQAQAEVDNATKNAANPHFRSRYADLAEVLNTVRPVFAKHGVAILQGGSFDGSMVHVTTTLAHKSGGHVSSVFSCVPAKSDAQGIGSAQTYGRRYSLAALCGVAQEDDDGNSSAHSRPPEPVKEDPRVGEAVSRIADATASELSAIGADLARLDVDEASKKKLRTAFVARRKALEEAASHG